MRVIKPNYNPEDLDMRIAMHYVMDVVSDSIILADMVENQRGGLHDLIDTEFSCDCGRCHPEDAKLYHELLETFALNLLAHQDFTAEEWKHFGEMVRDACAKDEGVRRYFESTRVYPILSYLIGVANITFTHLQESELCLEHYWNEYKDTFQLREPGFNTIVREIVDHLYQELEPPDEVVHKWHDTIHAYIMKESQMFHVPNSDN